MADFQGPPPRKKISLDNNKLNLVVPCPSAEGKLSKLIWGLNKNAPHITVYTGDPADESPKTNNGRIKAELDLPVLFSMYSLIARAINEQAGWKEQLQNWNYTFFGGKRSDKPANTTNIWIGKDKEGVIYISVVDAINRDRPVIKFDIKPPTQWHKFVHGDGTPWSKEEASKLFAGGYVKLLEGLYAHLAVTEFVPYTPPQKNGNGGGGFQRGGNGGGGGGGYQQRGGGDGGGYSRPAADVSNDDGDDLPF